MITASAYTAVIRQDGPWLIGWVEEVPGVNVQEQSREALLESLREALIKMT
jgi:predicted RNase H-like HicB family nuclease